MSTQGLQVFQLSSEKDIRTHLSSLNNILKACVDEGSSVGFLVPFSPSEAEKYWLSLVSSLSSETLHLFIITSPSSSDPGEILGTVQLSAAPKLTHFHRAEVQKLLVLPTARRRGIARRLMDLIEEFARTQGKEMLLLDTATESSAREMYRRLGWEEWGTCQGYAVWTDGSKCDATFFRKEL